MLATPTKRKLLVSLKKLKNLQIRRPR